MASKNVLHLPLKGKWFRMIQSGVKPEEYREINKYWAKRLTLCFQECANASQDGSCCKNCQAVERHLNCTLSDGHRIGPFTHVHFSLGYPKYEDKEKNMIKEIKEIVIGEGNPEWGAEPGKKYFVIRFK